MPTYLITGATGGLGSAILAQLRRTLDPATDTLIASSSSPASQTLLASRGYPHFRVVNYDAAPGELSEALRGVDKLLFTSSSTFDNERRSAQHRNVVDAAAAAGVGHVYYTSLAFGGLGDASRVSVQAAHLETERMLRASGLRFTSVREGVYVDAFPLFLEWYPGSETMLMPEGAEGGLPVTEAGQIAMATRAELGEGTAELMRSGKFDAQQVVLLSGPEALTLAEMVATLNAVIAEHGWAASSKGRVKGNVVVRTVSRAEYARAAAERDEGGKPEAFFQSRLSWYDGLAAGDAATVTSTLQELLGRPPTGMRRALRELLEAERGEYTWHQNYYQADRHA